MLSVRERMAEKLECTLDLDVHGGPRQPGGNVGAAATLPKLALTRNGQDRSKTKVDGSPIHRNVVYPCKLARFCNKVAALQNQDKSSTGPVCG